MNTFVSRIPYRISSRTYGLNRLNIIRRSYAKEPNSFCPPPKSKKDASTGSVYTIGAITVLGFGTIAYAKYDPSFRRYLGDTIPYADGFFRVIFAEEQSYGQQFSSLTSMLVGKDNSSASDRKRKIKEQEIAAEKETTKPYTPPRAVFPAIADEKKEKEKSSKYSEIREQNKDKNIDIGKSKSKDEVKEKPKGQPSTIVDSVADLELKINNAAKTAIDSYRHALIALKEYNTNVDEIIDRSVEKTDPKVWATLKTKTEAKHNNLIEAEKNAIEALKNLDTLNDTLDSPSLNASEGVKSNVKRNIDRLKKDISSARHEYEQEREASAVVEVYWKKVECARNLFIDELETMFPDFDVNKKKFKMQPSDLDLFLMHCFANVCYYQKELNRLNTIGEQKMRRVMEMAQRNDPDFNLVEAAICEGIQKEKRKLAVEFQKRCLALRKESELELRHLLKCQEQAHIDHLADVLQAREAEIEQDFSRKLNEVIALEHGKYKMQMAGMIARMKGMKTAINGQLVLDDEMKERVEADTIVQKSQVLWSACQALHRAVKNDIPGIPWSQQIRPLKNEVEAIKKVAASNDELVQTVVNGIPPEALERGVFPECAIRERFLKVARMCKTVALVPDNGGGLPLYFLSYFQSLFLINSVNPIPQSELEDEKMDFACLDTFDILQRARYWLDRGNFAQSLKYMNLLRGAPRCVAKEWIKETRILLETQQAAETLMAHAVSSGLLHL